jgi:hypothetical protein
MKTVLALMLACACASGCMAEVDPSAKTDKQSTGPDPSLAYPATGSSLGYDCNVPDNFVYLTVQGHSYWVRIPTACNSNPDIYKGDPGPDVGDPYDNKDPVSKEMIIQVFSEKYAAKIAAAQKSL